MHILLLNQCFYPDLVATAQHLSDLARGLVERGHHVTVIASRRGYDNPAIEFPARESWQGIEVRRIWTLNLGKTSRWRRAATFASFWISCVWHLLMVPRSDVVVALTSPPLISFLAALLVRVRGGRLVLWLMDLNPDEALAAGWLRPNSLSARLLTACQRYSFGVAEDIVALDRFMAERVARTAGAAPKVTVVAPWSHDDHVRYDSSGRLAFRTRHGLSDKYVIMYSGNHSPCHPLDTLMAAAMELRTNPDIAFCFIGGGSEFTRVQAFASAHQLANIVCLPYQPLEQLSASLSAADLHVVVMGDAFTGIVHPCKLYNILMIGVPFIYIGPEQSHISDILEQIRGLRMKDQGGRIKEDGSRPANSILNPSSLSSQSSILHPSSVFTPAVRHGQVDALVTLIQEAATAPGRAPSQSAGALAARFSQAALLPRLIAVVEGPSARTALASEEEGLRGEEQVHVNKEQGLRSKDQVHVYP